MREEKQLIPSWQLQGIQGKYENHVIIIGESMRKDYMSAYGYPLETTPFLANTPGAILMATLLLPLTLFYLYLLRLPCKKI